MKPDFNDSDFNVDLFTVTVTLHMIVNDVKCIFLILHAGFSSLVYRSIKLIYL